MTPQESEEFIVNKEEAGSRLDKLLADRYAPHFSRTYFADLIEDELVLLNGKIPKKRLAPVEGDVIEIYFRVKDLSDLKPENIPLDIVFEDEHLIIINKSAGFVVHPAPGNWSGTFVNALLYHCQVEKDGSVRPGIVHRLDKDTSGLMVVARTSQAQTSLVRQLQDRTVGRRYLAWVWGDAPSQGKVLASVGRDQRDRLKMAAGSPQGKPAATLFRRLSKGLVKGSPVTLLECRLETGRTHQIRVHLESLGFPLVGDPVYRKRTPGVAKDIQFSRQALHAFALSLQHPVKNELMTWFRLPPQDILDLLPQLEMDDEVLPKEAVVLASIQNESQA